MVPLKPWLAVCNQSKPQGTAARRLLKHSAMLELPRGRNASGHKGVFQRLEKQVNEKREGGSERGREGGREGGRKEGRERDRGDGGQPGLADSLAAYAGAAQILMIFNIEPDLIFFPVKL